MNYKFINRRSVLHPKTLLELINSSLFTKFRSNITSWVIHQFLKINISDFIKNNLDIIKINKIIYSYPVEPKLAPIDWQFICEHWPLKPTLVSLSTIASDEHVDIAENQT